MPEGRNRFDKPFRKNDPNIQFFSQSGGFIQISIGFPGFQSQGLLIHLLMAEFQEVVHRQIVQFKKIDQ